MMQTAYSTNGLKEHTLDEAFALIKSHGFDLIELSYTREHFKNLNIEEAAAYVNELQKKHQIKVHNIHTGEPFLLSQKAHYPSLISADDKSIERIDFLKSMIDLAEKISCSKVTIVSGLLEKNLKEDQALQRLTENIKELLTYTPESIQILIEQEPEMYIASTNDLLKLMQIFKGKLKVNLDIGHLEVLQESIPQSIKSLKKHILNIHFEDIKNNLHQHLLPGDGDIDFSAFFTCLQEIQYKHPLSADLYPFGHIAQKALSHTSAFLRENLENSKIS